ncbi:hypothetical protein [Dyella japonica]|uniref:Lipoprotein n=1 Tax=Dyella japonica A8 TaxID=1217721 RepID=A0A075K7W2_9GAMM|nr:hypothetical protein [Dyella japonica]AIF48243.1 hypothetical protein HY57_13775 [Dyella japonica A8]
MGTGHHLRQRLASFACLAGIGLFPCAWADQAGPVLQEQTVMGTVSRLTDRATTSRAFSISAVSFEPSTREWTVPVSAAEGQGVVKNFIATINESTGLACLRLPPGAGCVVTIDIHQQVIDAKARTEAELMAQTHPAPDLQQMAEVLIRYQLDPKRSGASASGAQALYYVTLQSPDNAKGVDLSPEVVTRLRRDGIETHPGSEWVPPGRAATSSLAMHYSIGLPVRRPDGRYDVSFGYYCGTLCAGWFTAVMTYDAAGWHVVSTVMNAIS